MTLEHLVWLVVGLSLPTLVAVLLLLFPHRIVQLQGKFYRHYYRGIRKLPNDDIDASFQLPTDQLLMGKRSEFIQRSHENPKHFRSLIFIYRIIGILIGVMLLLTTGLLLLGYLSGMFF